MKIKSNLEAQFDLVKLCSSFLRLKQEENESSLWVLLLFPRQNVQKKKIPSCDGL